MYQKLRTYIRYFMGKNQNFSHIPTHSLSFHKHVQARISIITSVFKGDLFIEAFLADIVQQTIFHECELILINAASPGKEEAVIFEYMKRFSNIVYIKLGYDPGLYAVWNLGVKIARGAYITNANLDDRVRHDCYALHAKALDEQHDVDLVYSDIYVTYKPNETMQQHSARTVQESPEFSALTMNQCLPNDHPMWRKTMHDTYGLFNETYRSAGDYEMWLRAVAGGAQFKKVHGVLGLHYMNPVGLSTNQNNPIIEQEVRDVRQKYEFLWMKDKV